eukprot:scaffold6877_cov135-Skeletonema_menzelii.AAC.6
MKVASIRSRVGLKVRRLPAMKALFLLLIASTTAFQRAPPVVAPSRINNAPKQPRCAFPRPSHLGGTNDGLRVTSDDLVGIRGGGDGSPPSIVAKSRAFVSKNFFLIGMASFAHMIGTGLIDFTLTFKYKARKKWQCAETRTIHRESHPTNDIWRMAILGRCTIDKRAGTVCSVAPLQAITGRTFDFNMSSNYNQHVHHPNIGIRRKCCHFTVQHSY